MAKVVDEPLEEKCGKNSKYPWNEWLDGRHWLLAQGEDFACDPKNLRNAAIAAAMRRGLKCRTSNQDDGLHIQAYRPEEQNGR